MAEIVAEKIFEYYVEFPEEVRGVVINEMEPDDRCRFTRCSKLSQKEAQKCKNYIYGLKFDVYSQNEIRFTVIYDENPTNNFNGDYYVSFTLAHDRNKYIVYSDRFHNELWRSKLDYSTNLIQYACENFKYMLNQYQKTIKKLELLGTGNYDFGIRSLSNLESLKLDDNTDIRQIMSKIQKPLKKFVCSPPISEMFTREFQQIFEVQNRLDAQRIHLNYAQFLQLSAANIRINIGILTEENISNFIISWRNDKLRNNFRSCECFTIDSNFDIRKLFRLLSIHHNFEERRDERRDRAGIYRTIVDIAHNTIPRKKAELRFNHQGFKFNIINR